MNKKEIVTLLKYLSKSFPNQLEFPTGDEKDDQTTISTWHDWLGDFSIQQVKKATKKASVADPNYVPGPPRIVKSIKNTLEEEVPSAEEAWKEVLEAIHSHDPHYSRKELVSSLTERQYKSAKAAGGLTAINERREGDTYIFSRFKKRFDELKKKEAVTDVVAGQEDIMKIKSTQ